jgi:hypothetical protein
MSDHNDGARTGGVFHYAPDGSQPPIDFRSKIRPAIGNAARLGHYLHRFEHRLDVVLIDLQDFDAE